MVVCIDWSENCRKPERISRKKSKVSSADLLCSFAFGSKGIFGTLKKLLKTLNRLFDSYRLTSCRRIHADWLEKRDPFEQIKVSKNWNLNYKTSKGLQRISNDFITKELFVTKKIECCTENPILGLNSTECSKGLNRAFQLPSNFHPPPPATPSPYPDRYSRTISSAGLLSECMADPAVVKF